MGVITDCLLVEMKEMLGSFVVVKLTSIDEAAALAYGCPILERGGKVEIPTNLDMIKVDANRTNTTQNRTERSWNFLTPNL